MLIREAKGGYNNMQYVVRLEGENPTNEELFRFCYPNFVSHFGGSVEHHYGRYAGDGDHRNVTVYTN